MKQSLTLSMVCMVLFTLSCKKEVVEHQQPFTPTKPQGKIIMVGNFEIAQQTLDKWVYSTKKKLTFINKNGDSLLLRVRENISKRQPNSAPVSPTSPDVYYFKADVFTYSLLTAKDSAMVSATLFVEPELKENATKFTDNMYVYAPYTDGKWYWAYMFFKIINVRTFTEKTDDAKKVDELTINGRVYKNVYTAPAINYNDSLGIVSFFDTNKTQWSVVKVE
jgi:hypothetical protein